jgi:hypothetical protein
MLKSLALLNGGTTVTDREFEEFLELSKYLNCQFNPIYGGADESLSHVSLI